MSPGTSPLAAVADDLLVQVEALSASLVEGIAEALPELVADPRVRELLRSTVFHNVISALQIVSGSGESRHPQAPPVAFEFAKRLAQQGIPLTMMLRAYRLGQAGFQQTVLARLGAAEITTAQLVEASMTLSAIAFEFIDAVSEQVVAVYQRERDEWLSQRNATRLGHIKAVLAGTVGELGEVENVLGLSLSAPVLGAILWFDHGHGADVAASMDQQVGALAEALGSHDRAAVSVAADGSTVWTWLPGCTSSEVRDGYAPAPGIHVALGRPEHGVEGFRRTHRQARQVHALALTAQAGSAPALLTSVAIGPLALIGSTLEDIRGWVGATLGPLAARDEASARLRETVWSYLAGGSSLNSAAAQLHVHKNTIQYRLHRADEVRGRPLHGDRLDVEVALLAWRLLGDAALPA